MNQFYSFLLPAALLLFSISGCKKDPGIDPGTRGSQSFKVYHAQAPYDVFPGVTVGMTDSRAEARAGRFTQLTQVTTSSGQADFRLLVPTKYYYQASILQGGMFITTKLDSIVVSAGDSGFQPFLYL